VAVVCVRVLGDVQDIDTRVRVRIPLGETSPGISYGVVGEPGRHVINLAPEIWVLRYGNVMASRRRVQRAGQL
jgi:hypothetical protein